MLFNSQQIKPLIAIAICLAQATTPSTAVDGLASVFSLMVDLLLPLYKT
jgi:hypothetical protein